MKALLFVLSTALLGGNAEAQGVTADGPTIDEPTSVTLTFDENGAEVTVTGPAAEDAAISGVDAVLERLDEIDSRFDELEARLDTMEGRLDAMEGQTDLGSEQIDDAQDAVGDEIVPSAVAWASAVEVAEIDIVSDAISYTGPVLVRGVVKGDAVSMVDDVHIAATGVVYGDAVSFGGNVIVDEGGTVRGDRVALGRHGHAVRSVVAPPVVEGSGPFSLFHDLARRIALILSFAGVGVLVVGFWPGQVDHVAHLIVERPVWYSLAGMILTGMLVLATLVLTFTVVGIPIALLLAVLLAMGWLLGFVGACKAVGERFAVTRERGAWAAFLAGAALLMAVGLVPWVGTFAIVMIGFPAVGAALVSRFGKRIDPDVM